MMPMPMRGDQFFQEISRRPPFTKLHPRVADFFKNYFANEKAVAFDGRHVINTHFPPYPSPAFDQLAEQFSDVGEAARRRLYSVTLAVTNRCPFRCWHCYNAGRSQQDVPAEVLCRLAGELQDLGAVMVTLTGGEPLLRDDLLRIVSAFDSRSCLILGTTGEGLSAGKARALREAGLFGVGVSLDSAVEAEHDGLRGRTGAFRNALRALETAREQGLYPYVVSVATREFLVPSRFHSFLRFVAELGALELHLLEPSATGKLAGKTSVLLSAADRQKIIDYQAESAGDDSLPIVSSFAYLEAPNAFGCGAGLTHIYIDGSGEVCPCNLVPLSFGNIARASCASVLERMGKHFCRPRETCVGRMLARHFPTTDLPAPPEVSEALCARHLPPTHAVPAFFRIRDEAAAADLGPAELRTAYNEVHGAYDDFWLSAAADPIHELLAHLSFTGRERVLEAGCGTGYATALIARQCAQLQAVDISEGMQSRARQRVASLGLANVVFSLGDAMQALQSATELDLVFSSWVLGYIPLRPFFRAAFTALRPGGHLAFVVHRDNSPREPLDIFAALVSEDPAVLRKRVAFEFPRNPEQVHQFLSPDFEVKALWEGAAVFHYGTAAEVLEHLLKSGAGTAFYDALDPVKRPALTARFLQRLAANHPSGNGIDVRHEYISCVAVRR